MDAEQVLAFRYERSGLAERTASVADAAACPASDFQKDAALLALAARAEGVTRASLDEVVVAHVIRGAIHAVRPEDHGLYGRALLSDDDDELTAQLGEQVRRERKRTGIPTTEALAEVAAATTDALREGPQDRLALHAKWRETVREELLPWCKGCRSHHVAAMLWRYSTVAAGARLDAERRYLPADPDEAEPGEAVRRFLRFYGPSTPAAFAEWAGLAKSHAQRLWAAAETDLVETESGWLAAGDEDTLARAERPRGVRLLPPGDPFLQKPNRPLLAPDDAVRKRLFRPVASPGAVLHDGRLIGLWKAKAKGKGLELTVEPLAKRPPRAALQEEAERIRLAKGASALSLSVG